ncbi:MAG: CRISPR-associated endonuclease Cas2 [Victivallales bacterium]
MLVIVSYDVSTLTKEGRKRLRHVARICQSYGQRVQNSVFECELDHSQWVKVKAELLNEINLQEDSLRIYLLGNHWHGHKEHFGTKKTFDIAEDVLLI